MAPDADINDEPQALDALTNDVNANGVDVDVDIDGNDDEAYEDRDSFELQARASDKSPRIPIGASSSAESMLF